MSRFKTQSSFQKLQVTAAALLMWGAGAGYLHAQSYYGSVRGIVSDQNGGAMLNAKVTLADTATGGERSTITSGSGEYVFSEVVPSTYSITGESPGFKRFERKGIVIGTQQQITVDVGLEVGQVTESVQVTEDAPLVETANASQGQVIDNQKLVDLPNLGRNPFLLSKLVQNVMPVGNPAYNRMQDQSGSSAISIAGGPVRGNNYLLDGVPITDANNRAIIIPAIEAVQEVKIQANTYDAEMARTGGGMFNTLIKSGGNGYHGSLYGHIRRTDWDANNFFNNAAGIPITDQPNDTWGASFGGKIWIPKVYDGKNRTFFFLGVEKYSDTQSDSSQFTAPTALERVGDFSKSGITIYDPLTPIVNGTRTPFAGNIIPASRLNPVGLALASHYELPTSQSASYGDPNVSASTALKSRASQLVGKLDEDFTRWWHASLSYLRYFSAEPGNNYFGTVAAPEQWKLERRVDSTQINSLFTVSPSLIVAVRYGFNRFPNFDYQESIGFNVASLGFSPNFVSQVNPALATFPYVGMTSLYSLGDSFDNSFYVHASRNFSTEVSKYIGRHSIKGGFDFRRIKAAGNDHGDASGTFNFTGIFTKSNPNSSGEGGADLADLLLGYPHDATGYSSTKLTDYADYYGFYLQDDFRLSTKLTLNFGLRWERELGLQEINNGMVVNFNTTAANPLAANVTGISPQGIVEFAGTNGRTTVGDPTLNKFSPRIGVAWQANDKTVVRGGYGIFWAPQFALGAPISTPGYNAQTNYVATNDGYATPAGTLSDPFPAGITQPVGNTLGAATGNGQTISLVDPHAHSPMVQQYSIDIQRQLPSGIAVEIGYVGSHTTNLTLGTSAININALNPSLLSQGSALTQSVANPFAGNGGTGVIGSSQVQASQLLRPYPTFNNVNLLFSDRNHARYDSLILKGQKRFSHGLTFLSAFTWSRNHDASSGGPANTLNQGNVGPQNPYDTEAEYSLSNIDSPFRWTTSFSYELPVGKGKAFSPGNSIVDYVIGGWSVNGVSIFQTGFPLQISQSQNFNSSLGYASQRPNATGTSPETSGSLEDRLGGYINKAAFSQAPAFTFGNISRTISMRGPGQVNWDLSMFKTVTIRERFRAQFRAEALNAMNTPLFYGPNTSFGSGSFGKITSQANFARQLQLALRFSF